MSENFNDSDIQCQEMNLSRSKNVRKFCDESTKMSENFLELKYLVNSSMIFQILKILFFFQTFWCLTPWIFVSDTVNFRDIFVSKKSRILQRCSDIFGCNRWLGFTESYRIVLSRTTNVWLGWRKNPVGK